CVCAIAVFELAARAAAPKPNPEINDRRSNLLVFIYPSFALKAIEICFYDFAQFPLVRESGWPLSNTSETGDPATFFLSASTSTNSSPSMLSTLGARKESPARQRHTNFSRIGMPSIRPSGAQSKTRLNSYVPWSLITGFSDPNHNDQGQ